MEFANVNDGVATGPSGQVLHTADGGRTWNVVFALGSGAKQLDFSTATSGWALLSRSLLRTSSDGRAWSSLGEPKGHALSFVDVVSTSLAYGLTNVSTGGSPELVVSRDGGTSWNVVGTPGQVQATCFVTPSSGWIVVRELGVIAIEETSNGGVSWSKQATITGGDHGTLDCQSASAAWVVIAGGVGLGSEASTIYRFSAAHVSWVPVAATSSVSAGPAPGNVRGLPQAPGDFPGKVVTVSNTTAYVAGVGVCSPTANPAQTDLCIGSTHDGGTTWAYSDVSAVRGATGLMGFGFGYASAQNAVAFVSYSTGQAQGVTKILRTTDGGRSWASFPGALCPQC
jgi:hypothetical protein